MPDHDRPLAGRGRRAAKAIARHLHEQGIEPDLVLCSSARRARETLERIERALGTPIVQVERELYAASASALLERLRSVPGTVESVLLIGHNPGLHELALELARESPAVRELATKYPTAALATLAFPHRAGRSSTTTWPSLSSWCNRAISSRRQRARPVSLPSGARRCRSVASAARIETT